MNPENIDVIRFPVPTIKIDNIVEFYMEHQQADWSDKDFPNVAPPFEEFIMEFSIPEYIVINGERLKHPAAYSKWNSHWKVTKERVRNTEGNIIEGWNMEIVINSSIGAVCAIRVFSNFQGVLTDIFPIQDKTVSTIIKIPHSMVKTGTPEESRGLSDFFTSIIQPQLLSLSFMNCKNVSKELIDPNKGLPKRVLKHWEKKGKPLLDKYYILNIDPMKKVLKTEGDSDSVGVQKAMHICRGHFKNYTEGKGLFGKYHGMYWVDSHVKGNKDFGTVNKDYNIKI